ncbi:MULTISPECIES: acyl-CoA synthetase [unclassified Mycobacterium]|uniref:acyl-CoA synthetase n=1 Tax=unclassified Mycobacterium TaxID=2642494 RepID=UPI0029C66A10|nr:MULTISPECIES: acyl-CoA synthetase [unclassified Mycobacterium]
MKKWQDWPSCRNPQDLSDIEATALADRDLPACTYELVADAEARWADKTALYLLASADRWDCPETWTYTRLARTVRQCANLFHAQGISRAHAVTVMSPNTGLVLAATLAAQTAGIVAPVNPALTAERLVTLVRTAGSTVIVAAGPELDPDIWAKARNVASAVGARALYAVRPEDRPGQGPDLEPLAGIGVAYLDTAMAAHPDTTLACATHTADDIASYFHTGGTTGAPKLAAHTHRNEVAMAWSLALQSTLPEPSTVLAGLPLFHVNAVLVTGLSPLFRGHPVVWVGPHGFRDLAIYQHFWKIVERYGVAAMSAVPTVYAVLAEIAVDADISSLQIAAVGAAPLPDAVRARFHDRTGLPLSEGYGLTEAACVSAASQFDVARPGSVGLRLPYQRIVATQTDECGHWIELPAGHSGQLMIHGPTVFPGYVGADGQLAAGGALHDGGLLTGDLGFVDDDGYVFLVGRAKDVIIRGGHNIDPATIEDAMLEHPSVIAAGAVGRPDPHSGEVPVVYVATSVAVDEDDLVTWAREQITEPAAVPKAVHVVEAIPVTQIGKPFKPALRADAARRAVADALAEHGFDGECLDVTAEHDDEGRLVVSVTGVPPTDLDGAREQLARLPVTTSFVTDSAGAPNDGRSRRTAHQRTTTPSTAKE